LRDWSGAEKYCNLYFAQLAQGKNGPMKTEFVPYAYSVRALARRAQKNFAGAIEDDTLVIKLAPESALAYRDRGDAYRQSGKYDLAVADYTKAIQLDSAQGSSNYWRRAKAYEKLNQAALAKQDSETAKKLDARPNLRFKYNFGNKQTVSNESRQSQANCQSGLLHTLFGRTSMVRQAF
jgi:tetratricopeptide (TPR) repeat protein